MMYLLQARHKDDVLAQLRQGIMTDEIADKITAAALEVTAKFEN